MKFLTAPSVLAAALLSAALAAPFHGDWTTPDRSIVLEARLASTAAGHVQVYYDTGVGFQEKASVLADLAASAEPRLYRLVIPAGSYRRLRFDPIDRDGTVTIAAARLLDSAGRLVRGIPFSQFQPLNQIQSLAIDHGLLRVEVVPGGNDPQLLLTYDPPLEVRAPLPWAQILRPAAGPALGLWAGLILLLLVADRAPRLRRRLGAAPRWCAAHPHWAIAAVAALATVASSYPVVFLHRSFVSPEVGATLLYDRAPTLPGARPAPPVDVEGSDVGAILWQHVPLAAIERRALLRDRELPWWNRYDSAGTPLIGQGQSMFGDPLHFLVLAAGGASWAWDLKYLAAKWLLALGLGLAVATLCRHPPAAWLTAAAAPFFGLFLFRVNHPDFFSFCYAPWPLYCWLGLSDCRSVRSAVRWSVGLILANAALLDSGTVKEAYLLLAILNLAGAAAVLAAPASARRRLAILGAIAAGAVLFAALTAPSWYTFLDALRDARTSYDTPSAFQIQPGLLLGAFDEAFYRPLTPDAQVFDPAANFLVLGGVLYFLATLRHQCADRRVAALAATSLLPLGLAFGFVPPLWIARWPFLGQVAHLDNTFSCPLILLCAVLAGAGFAAAGRRLGTKDGAGDLGIAFLLLFGLIFAYVGFGQAVHRSVQGAAATFSVWSPGESLPVRPLLWLYLALLVAALAGLALVARRTLRGRPCSPALALVAVLCGYALLWRQAEEPPAAAPSKYWYRPGGRADFQAPSPAVRRVQQAVLGAPARSIGLQNNLFPGWTAMYGLEGVSGPDALMDPRYRELTESSPLEELWDWRLYLDLDHLAAARPFLDFLNVRYYFDLPGDQAALGAALRPVQEADLQVYESPTVWPRAFFTDRLWRYTQPADLVNRILHGDGRPFAAAQAPDLPAGSPPRSLPDELAGRTVTPAAAYRLTEDSTAFSVTAPASGIAVLTETGWAGYGQAEVDGRPAPLYRVNHAFLGVFLAGPGTHRIVVTYAPRHRTLLLALSLGAGLALAAAWVCAGRRPDPAAFPIAA